MKKLLTVSIIAVMFIMLAITGVNASTKDALANRLYEIGAKYGMTAADRAKLESYLADNPVSDAEAESVIADAEAAAKVMEEAGVTDYKKLPAEDKATVRGLANNAASTLDVTLAFTSNGVEVYKDGKLLDTITDNGGKLVYTGNNSTVLVVSSIAVIALVAFVVAGKKLANA